MRDPLFITALRLLVPKTRPRRPPFPVRICGSGGAITELLLIYHGHLTLGGWPLRRLDNALPNMFG